MALRAVQSGQGRARTGVRGPGASGIVPPALSLPFSTMSSAADLTAKGVTLTRASANATRINSSGLLEVMAADAPRFDYDRESLAPLGLLREPQRKNGLTDTRDFTTATWVKRGGATVAADAGMTRIDGTTGAMLFSHVASGADVYYSPNNTGVFPNSKRCEGSLWLRRVTPNGVLRVQDPNNDALYGRWLVNFAMLPDRWVRLTRNHPAVTVSVEFKSTASGAAGMHFVQDSGAATLSFYADLVQRETDGANDTTTSTSPIICTTVPVTRAADVAVMTGTAFSSWFNQVEGTFFVEGDSAAIGAADAAPFISINDGTTAEAIELRYNTGNAQFIVTDGGASQVAMSLGSAVASAVKIAAAYKLNDFKGALQGTQGTPDTVGTLPTPTQMVLSGEGHLKTVTYYSASQAGAVLASGTAPAAPTVLPSLPTGAVAIWYSDQAVASTNTIPNSVAGGPAVTLTGAPNYADGVVDLSSGGGAYGTTVFSPALSLSTFTVIALASKVAPGSTLNGLLGTNGVSTGLVAMFDANKAPSLHFGSATDVTTGQAVPNTWDLQGDGFRAQGFRFDGTNGSVWLNDTQLYGQPVSPTVPVSVSTLNYGTGENTGYLSGHKISAVAMWDRALTDAEFRSAYAALVARAQVSSISVGVDTRVLTAEGDSITLALNGASTNGGYVRLFAPNSTGEFRGSIRAINGNTLADLIARAPLVDAVVPPSHGGRTFVLSVLVGANDLVSLSGYGGDVNAYVTALMAYYDARRAAGYKVLACTVLPTTNPTLNANRAIVNSAIRAAVGVHCDAVCDFAADAQMGADNAYTAFPLNWADTVHPNNAGQVRMEAIYRPALNALW